MRLFVAVNPPGQLSRDLDTRLDAMRSLLRIAWVRPEAWHLTLAFLGDWPEERLPTLGAALREAVAHHRPFVITPGKLDAFPTPQRPRVLFVHLDGDDQLQNLAADVRRAVDTAWPDGPQDHKVFRPHLTLARIKRPLAGAEHTLLKTLDLGGFASFEVERVALMTSDLRPDGARHAVVESMPLDG